ncbi:MAG TPA: hypothetical protein VJ302_03615 [Blastocatellia bacterium]|nr:hypothetical protein [Blastocatellia bacterium]
MISPAVIKLCEAVRAAGGRALFVGGGVRDLIRGFELVDYDLEVYGVEATRLRELLEALGRVDAVGEAFTVYKVKLRDEHQRLVIDVSIPRRESKTGRGHRGFVVTGDPGMSYEEAARRRDFTINAIMYDPLADEYLDPYGGRDDLQRQVIRIVDPRTFIEDSLRVLRAMQFASRFEFGIDSETVELCRGIDLSDLPAERIWAEVEKWLLQSRRPALGLHAARSLGIVEKLWPELHALADDLFAHTAATLDEARQLLGGLPRPRQVTVMLAALCHDFGLPLTTGDQPAESFLDRLKIHTFSNYHVRGQVTALVRHRFTPRRWFEAQAAGQPVTDGMFRRLALKVEPELLYRVERAGRLSRAGAGRAEAEDWFMTRVRSLGIERRAPEPLLKGRHVLALGLQPGRLIGEVISAVYELQLDGTVSTEAEAIAAARRFLESRFPGSSDEIQ